MKDWWARCFLSRRILRHVNKLMQYIAGGLWCLLSWWKYWSLGHRWESKTAMRSFWMATTVLFVQHALASLHFFLLYDIYLHLVIFKPEELSTGCNLVSWGLRLPLMSFSSPFCLLFSEISMVSADWRRSLGGCFWGHTAWPAPDQLENKSSNKKIHKMNF